jgi:hypothetical protein
MKVMRVLITTLSILCTTPLWSQIPQEVTLTVSADGTSKEDATKNALRSAIEQAYGTFVSANTTLLNDEIVKNEIVTISSGNVKGYTELSNVIRTDGTAFVTLEATVSIPGLISYSKQHGSSCEFAGNTFAMNTKLKELRIQNAITAYKNMCLQISELADAAFDYTVKLSGPILEHRDVYSVFKGQSGGEKGIFRRKNGTTVDGYEVDVTISVLANNTTSQIYDLVYTTLNAIALSKEEIVEFKNIGYNLMTYGEGIIEKIGINHIDYFGDHFSYITDELRVDDRNKPKDFCIIGGIKQYQNSYEYTEIDGKSNIGYIRLANDIVDAKSYVLPFSKKQYEEQLMDIDEALSAKMFLSLVNFKLINIANENYYLTTRQGLDSNSKVRGNYNFGANTNLNDFFWLVDSNGETTATFKCRRDAFGGGELINNRSYRGVPGFLYKMKHEIIYKNIKAPKGEKYYCIKTDLRDGKYSSLFKSRIDNCSNWVAWRLPDYVQIETKNKKKKGKSKQEQESATPKYQNVEQEIVKFTIPFFIPKDQMSNFGGFRIEKNNQPIITNF